jgi:hypothetical protein
MANVQISKVQQDDYIIAVYKCTSSDEFSVRVYHRAVKGETFKRNPHRTYFTWCLDDAQATAKSMMIEAMAFQAERK